MRRLVLNADQMRKVDFIMTSPSANFSSLLNFEIKDLAVYWSFYSGKIEGNTYSYVETESLLKDDITPLKSYEDAVMLKNLYNAFISCVNQIKKEGSMALDAFTIKGLHSMLTDGLLPVPDRGALRQLPVKISGTNYVPVSDPFEIEETFAEIVNEQSNYDNPIAMSIFLHCNIARLQPFRDGNKRTSRLVESVALMNANIIPVRSDKPDDFVNYRNAIVAFYETEDYNPYIDFALDTQIKRINEISPAKYQFNGNSTGLTR